MAGGAIGYKNIPQADQMEDVFNSVMVQVPTQTVGAMADLWDLTDASSLDPGESYRFIAR